MSSGGDGGRALAVSAMNSYLTETRRTLVLAGPIIIGQVSQMLMGVTDAIMIGQVGKIPLAASAFAGSLWGFFFMVAIGLLIPVTILVSRAHGGGDEREAAEWMRHGAVLAAVAGVLGSLLLLALGSQLHRFGQPPEVLAEVSPYYGLIVASTLPTLLFQVQRQFAESMERPMVPMLITLAGVGLNVFLNWILIYGNLGAPALGLAGAGWATLISRTLGVFIIFAWIQQSDHFGAAWPRNWFARYEWSRFKSMLKLGVPIAFALSFEAGAFSIAPIFMGWLGATALAAHQIAISCAAFIFMVPLGLAMAVSMRVGRAVGAGRMEALRPIGHGAQIISALFTLALTVVLVFQGRWIASVFVSELEVILLATQLLFIVALFLLADGGQVVAANALRGLTDVNVPTVITAIAYWGLAIPLAWWLGLHTSLGPQGVWIGLAVGLIFAFVFLFIRFHIMTRDGGKHVKRDSVPEPA